MKVLFYGNALDYTRGEKKFESVKCPETSVSNVPREASLDVRGLVDELGNYYGDKLKEFLLGDETCFFLVNGRGIMMTGGLDTKLCHDDKIEVLPFADAG